MTCTNVARDEELQARTPARRLYQPRSGRADSGAHSSLCRADGCPRARKTLAGAHRGDPGHRASGCLVARVPPGRQLPGHAEHGPHAHGPPGRRGVRAHRRAAGHQGERGAGAARGAAGPGLREEPHAVHQLLRAAEGRSAGGVAHRVLLRARVDEIPRRAPHDESRHGARGARHAQRRWHAARGRGCHRRKAPSAASCSRRTARCYITGADRFRFYDSKLDGVDHDFTDNPDIRRNFSGRVLRINRDGSIPKDNPWLEPRHRARGNFRARVQGSGRRRDSSDHRGAVARSITARRAATR